MSKWNSEFCTISQ
uniref:Uncharacterized protein n=1 Tax=Lepeophtheirus salmonis TaxID=72036 RepID=A0A0K2TJN7_LEPSM